MWDHFIESSVAAKIFKKKYIHTISLRSKSNRSIKNKITVGRSSALGNSYVDNDSKNVCVWGNLVTPHVSR